MADRCHPYAHMDDIDLPWSFFNMHGLEFNGQISFLKAGLYYADHITAVSPTKEIWPLNSSPCMLKKDHGRSMSSICCA